jgi:uncharacterized protein with PIN domain
MGMEQVAVLRFAGELRDFLGKPQTDGVVRYPVTRRASLKDVIEALGPPHTEIHRLSVNGLETDFRRLLEPGMDVDIKPATFPIDVTRPTGLRPDPLPRLAFAADANVGKLATLLRLLGFDTSYDPKRDDASLADHAAESNRVVLSRDRTCLKRSRIVQGRWIRANEPRQQLVEVMAAYGLAAIMNPFSRCLRCNQPLVAVEKKAILDQLQPLTRRYYENFFQCETCGRIYWAGSHHEGMERLLRDLPIRPAPVPDRGSDASDRSAGPDHR